MSQLLAAAVEHHRSGRFRQAETIYRRVLRQDPCHADANHLFGLLAHQTGDNATAIQSIGKAVVANPQSALYRFTLGVVLEAKGDAEAAMASYREALALNANDADAHNNLGLLLEKHEKPDEAMVCFERATRINPDHVEAWVNFGRALQARAKSADARACFEHALKLNPLLAEAHFGVGKSLGDQRKWAEAEACYRQALAMKADFVEAQNNLGTALLAQGRYREARAVLRRLMEMKHGPIRATLEALEDERWSSDETSPSMCSIPRFKLVDRVDQLEYLLAKGLIDSTFSNAVARFRSLLDEVAGDGAITLPFDLARQVKVLCDSVIHYADAPAVASCAVNDSLDFRAIEEEYLSSPTPVVWFDDFLSPEALQGLRRFCLESTIYFGADPAGYVSSYVTNGFNSSLLYQIADELKLRMPRVIGTQFLSNMWVYRHQGGSKGVDAHTDYGAVTFNFWITPDSANLDPDRGGIVIYEKEQPFDWDWMEVNKKKNTRQIRERIKSFLGSTEPIAIPYRANRAVLFHSNLFHRSDDIQFKEGFENRRINISMLFGERRQSD